MVDIAQDFTGKEMVAKWMLLINIQPLNIEEGFVWSQRKVVFFETIKSVVSGCLKSQEKDVYKYDFRVRCHKVTISIPRWNVLKLAQKHGYRRAVRKDCLIVQKHEPMVL